MKINFTYKKTSFVLIFCLHDYPESMIGTFNDFYATEYIDRDFLFRNLNRLSSQFPNDRISLSNYIRKMHEYEF